MNGLALSLRLSNLCMSSRLCARRCALAVGAMIQSVVDSSVRLSQSPTALLVWCARRRSRLALGVPGWAPAGGYHRVFWNRRLALGGLIEVFL